MMEYFRKYLISLRRAENDGLFWNLQALLLIISIIGIGIGFLLDLFLSNGFLTNMFRGVIALISGTTLFSYSYLFSSRRVNKKRMTQDYYQSIRERFSYKQRLNFSIAVLIISSMFVLLGNESSSAFTFKAVLFVSVSLTLLAFTRRKRSEFIKDIYDLPDLRDLESAARRKAIKAVKGDSESSDSNK